MACVGDITVNKIKYTMCFPPGTYILVKEMTQQDQRDGDRWLERQILKMDRYDR